MFTPKSNTAYVIMGDNAPVAIVWTAQEGAIAVDVYGSIDKESQLYCVSKEEEGDIVPILISSDYSWASKMADRISRHRGSTWIDEIQVLG